MQLFNKEFEGTKGFFTSGEKSYSVNDLIELSKGLPVFDLSLQGIDLSRMPWILNNIQDFCAHYARVMDTDMNHPIILDSTGYICDGWHRLVKAIINGQETIKAVRLIVMPDPL
jgi:hypothetical protein